MLILAAGNRLKPVYKGKRTPCPCFSCTNRPPLRAHADAYLFIAKGSCKMLIIPA